VTVVPSGRKDAEVDTSICFGQALRREFFRKRSNGDRTTADAAYRDAPLTTVQFRRGA
jgi:hypothetical protein